MEIRAIPLETNAYSKSNTMDHYHTFKALKSYRALPRVKNKIQKDKITNNEENHCVPLSISCRVFTRAFLDRSYFIYMCLKNRLLYAKFDANFTGALGKHFQISWTNRGLSICLGVNSQSNHRNVLSKFFWTLGIPSSSTRLKVSSRLVG